MKTPNIIQKSIGGYITWLALIVLSAIFAPSYSLWIVLAGLITLGVAAWREAGKPQNLVWVS